MTKATTPTEMSKGQSDNTNNATKKFQKGSLTKKKTYIVTMLTFQTFYAPGMEFWGI